MAKRLMANHKGTHTKEDMMLIQVGDIETLEQPDPSKSVDALNDMIGSKELKNSLISYINYIYFIRERQKAWLRRCDSSFAYAVHREPRDWENDCGPNAWGDIRVGWDSGKFYGDCQEQGEKLSEMVPFLHNRLPCIFSNRQEGVFFSWKMLTPCFKIMWGLRH